MARSTLVRVLAVLLLSVVGLTILWVAWPSDDYESVVVKLGGRGKAKARVDTPRPVAPRVERRRAQPAPAPPSSTAGAPATDGRLSPDEKAEAREEFRQDRQADVDQRLDDFATKAHWSDDKTEKVRGLLLDTTDGISESLARVDRGEVTWDDERRNLRQFRLDQAKKVQDLLGNQFDDFVTSMSFERFLGEGPPQRGRIDTPPPAP